MYPHSSCTDRLTMSRWLQYTLPVKPLVHSRRQRLRIAWGAFVSCRCCVSLSLLAQPFKPPPSTLACFSLDERSQGLQLGKYLSNLLPKYGQNIDKIAAWFLPSPSTSVKFRLPTSAA